MDSVEEDVSARVLLKNVLHTETARSPVTRSVSGNLGFSNLRRSSRVKNTPGVQSPQVALRNKLKHKLHESATRSPVPPTKRPKSQGTALKTPVVIQSSLYDDDITPRGLLRGIIQTEAEASLLLSGQPEVPKTNQQPVETSLHSNRQSEGPSGLELPDLITEPLSNVCRGMSRRRPAPTFNVSTFERQLNQQSGEDEHSVTQVNTDVSEEQNLSAGSKSVLSLTLKTPFVNIQSVRGLRRKAAGRRQPSVAAFDEAVQKHLQRYGNTDSTVVQDEKTLGDSDLHRFTLGLSNVTVPDFTTDIVLNNTEPYLQSTVSSSEQNKDNLGTPERGIHECKISSETDRKRRDEVCPGEYNVEDPSGEKDLDNPAVEKEVTESQSKQNELCHKSCENEPETFQRIEDPETDFQLEEEEEDMIHSLQQKEPLLLGPDELPFAPTQAMTEPVLQDKEEHESEMQEAEVEKMEWNESGKEDLSKVELPSQLSKHITRRAYRSEGGTVVPGITATQRATKSLGAGMYSTEKKLPSFNKSSGYEELPDLEEEPYVSPASPFISHTLKPSSSVTHQTSLAEDEDNEREATIEGDISKSEDGNIVPQSPTPGSPNAEEHEQDDDDDDDEEDAHSEELSLRTPAFIRQRKEVPTPSALHTPTILKVLNAGPTHKVMKPIRKQKKRDASDVLPKSYVMSVFKHFAKTKVASDVFPVINEILQKYFDRLADDLEAYCAHAKRKTIEVEDVELLMRRQGFVTDSTPVNVLIEKFLPLEYRKLLIPVATSGNKVIPNRR